MYTITVFGTMKFRTFKRTGHWRVASQLTHHHWGEEALHHPFTFKKRINSVMNSLVAFILEERSKLWVSQFCHRRKRQRWDHGAGYSYGCIKYHSVRSIMPFVHCGCMCMMSACGGTRHWYGFASWDRIVAFSDDSLSLSMYITNIYIWQNKLVKKKN